MYTYLFTLHREFITSKKKKALLLIDELKSMLGQWMPKSPGDYFVSLIPA